MRVGLFSNRPGSTDFSVAFDWTGDSSGDLGDNRTPDLARFELQLDRMDYKLEGSTYDVLASPGERQWVGSGLGASPAIRCDRSIAKSGSRGCVFDEASAVFILSTTDPFVREAAVHVREAQNGSTVALYAGTQASPGRFVMLTGTRAVADSGSEALRRAKSVVVRDFNRARACQDTTSLYRTRLPLNQSNLCVLNQQPCSCDEYPFASTWDGAFFDQSRTSAKRINGAQNSRAGQGAGDFYLQQRVLDLTRADALTPGGGDSFWVYIK